ncbi:MAG: VOC family protein [Pseudomonadota bacterium]
MAKGDSVWCDLSAFRLEEAKAFYARLFGWTYERLTQPDSSPYDVASTPDGEAAGIFEMPQKLQQIGLPSFWMPYFAVDSVEAACDQAARRGGKVEVPPLAWSSHDRIALIRDPLGAGFTAYEGTGLNPRHSLTAPGQMVWRALYVSDAAAVRDFYEAVFDWRISKQPGADGGFLATTAGDVPVANIHALSEDLRGAYQFWGIHFLVPTLPDAKAKIEAQGGKIVYEDKGQSRTTVLAGDPDGAAFFIRSE